MPPNKLPSHNDRLKELSSQFAQHDPKQQERIRKFRSSGAWTKLSKWCLQTQPLCWDPFKTHRDEGRVVLSAEAHHVRMVATAWELRLSRDNVIGICKKCHHIVSRMEINGEDVISLFQN